MREATKLERAYLAGVIDSDGCIRVSRDTWRMRNADGRTPTFQARIHIKQVDPEATDLCYEIFGGYYRQEPPTAYRGKPLWSWAIHSAGAGRVLTAVSPYLRIKKAQAENALRVCELSAMGTRRFPVPEIVEGEPLVTAYEAAARLPFSYESICQAVRKGSVPFVRKGRNIFIPESFLEVWANRGQSPSRSTVAMDELEECFLRAKALNRVGT